MTSSDTIINTVKKQDNKNKNLPDEYDYSLEDIFSHMDSFEIFDNDYESLLRRIETFKDQTNKDSIPLHTMNTALQYMEHYLDLIQKEERRLDEKITHAKKQNHQRSVGVLILTKQKVGLMKQQITDLLDQFRGTTIFDADTIYADEYENFEDLLSQKELVTEMKVLITQHHKWQKDGLPLELDDSIEKQIEQDDDFLAKEHKLLVSIIHMQEKIAANTLHMQTICVDIFSPLLDRFNFDWDDTNFVLEDIDMNQTDFYQSYQQYLTEYEQRLTRTESIIATTQRRYRVASFDHKVIKKMRSAIKKIMKSTPFSQVKQAIKSLWVDYEVNYLLKVLPLLENTHFPLLVEKFHDDIYNRALADTLLVAEKHYQVFHRYLRLDELSGTIPFLSALCHHRRDMYLMSIEKHLGVLISSAHTGDINKLSDKDHDDLKQQRVDINHMIGKHNTLVESFQANQTLYKSLAKFSYVIPQGILSKKIKSYVRSTDVRSQLSMITINPAKYYENTNLLLWMKSYKRHLTLVHKELTQLHDKSQATQKLINQAHDDLLKSHSYTYKPYDRLGNILDTIISIKNGEGLAGALFQALVDIVEFAFNSQYRQRETQHSRSGNGGWGQSPSWGSNHRSGRSGRGSRRSRSGGGRSRGSRSGGSSRSRGSFGGGSRRSSGGTRW